MYFCTAYLSCIYHVGFLLAKIIFYKLLFMFFFAAARRHVLFESDQKFICTIIHSSVPSWLNFFSFVVCSGMLAWPSNMARSRNTASPLDLAKCFRANLHDLNPALFAGKSADEICETFGEVMHDILYQTSRPVKSVLEAAASIAFENNSKDECHIFCDRLMAGFAHCRDKKSQCTSMKKLTPAVRKIVEVMNKVADQQLASSLVQKETRFKFPEKRKAVSPAAARLSDSPLVTSMKRQAFSAMTAAKRRPTSEVEDLRRLYGMVPSSSKSPLQPGEVLAITSDSDEDLAAEASSKAFGEETPGKCGSSSSGVAAKSKHYCTSKGIARVEGGSIVNATMTAGPAGFMIAQFPGELPFVTELPNILQLPVLEVSKKRKAPVMKKPAAKAPQPAQQREQDDDSNDDEGEEEEQHEGEEEEEDVLEEEAPPAQVVEVLAPTTAKPSPTKYAHGLLKFVQAKAQSYITITNMSNDGKPNLLVAVSENQAKLVGKNHSDIAFMLWDIIFKEKLDSKAAVLAHRTRLLQCNA